MDDHNRKNEIAKVITDATYCSAALTQEEISTERYEKWPLSKISALGVAFEPLVAAFQSVTSGGGTSGIYLVNTKGGQLVHSANGPGYIGALARGNNQVGGGAASLTKLLPCDPTMLFMAAALWSINHKLDTILDAQKEILEYLAAKEKAKLRGNLNFLTDILNTYKHNWANEKYKNSNHIKVLDIKQDAEQSILLYREQIEKKAKRKGLLHSNKDVKDTLTKIQSEFKEYQLALYLYAFSAFLEVMLLENFDSVYLDGVAHRIEDYAFRYRELYTECYTQMEGYAQSSVQAHFINGLAGLNKLAGEAVAKIPVVSKSQIDETLIATGSRLENYGSKKTEQALEQLMNHQSDAVQSFVENINMVNRLYNQPLELLFDKENLYFSLPEH